MKKDLVLKKLQSNQHVSSFILKKYNDDIDVMKVALNNNPSLLINVSPRLKDHEDVVSICTKVWGDSIAYASSRLKKDKNFILNNVCLLHISSGITCFDKSLFKDEGFVIKLIESNTANIEHYLPKKIKNNPNIYRALIKSQNLYKFILKIGSNIYKEKDIIIEILRHNGSFLKNASNDLKNDKELVKQIVLKNPSHIQYASKSLRNDKELALCVVKLNGNCLEYLSSNLKNNKEVVLCAIQKNGESLKYVSKKLLNQKEIVEKAFKNHMGLNLNNIDINNSLKNCRDFVLKALKNKVNIFETVNNNLKSDKELAILALSINGFNYNHIDDAIKEDDDIIKKLIEVFPRMITINVKLKNNKKYALMVLDKNPSLYRYINSMFQKEEDVIDKVIAVEGQKIILDVMNSNLQDTNFVTLLLSKLESYNKLDNASYLTVKKILRNKDYKNIFQLNFKMKNIYDKNILTNLLSLKIQKDLLMMVNLNKSSNKKIKF